MENQSRKREIQRIIAVNPVLVPIVTRMVVDYLNDLPAGTRICLYGPTYHSRELVQNHSKQLKRHKITFVVGDAIGAAGFKDFGYPVIHADKLANYAYDLIILFRYTLHAKIAREISRIPPEKVFLLRDIIELKCDRSAENGVIEWMTEYLKPHVENIRKLSNGGKKIVCVTTYIPLHSLLKTIRQIRKMGFVVVLIVEHAKFQDGSSLEKFERSTDIDYCYEPRFSYPLELCEIVKQCHVSVVHAETGTWPNESLAQFLRSKPCPVVVEYRDVKATVFKDDDQAMEMLNLLPEAYEREKEAQKTVFTLADAVVYKESPRVIEYLTNLYGQGPARSLHFMHYTEPENIVRKPLKRSGFGDLIRIVYAGNIVNNPAWHNYPIFCSLLQAARTLDKLGVHFTIYNANDSNGEEFEEYLALSKELPHFEYRFAVPYHRLKHELSGFDFGWLCFDFSNAHENPFFLETTMGSKVFSYLEASLPIIVSPEQKFMAETVQTLGIGIPLHFSKLHQLRDIVASCDHIGLQKNILVAQERFSYQARIHHLEGLYRELVEDALPPDEGV